MTRIADKIDSMSVGKSNGDEEGSRFWKKLRILVSCMLWSPKREGSTSDKNKQDEERNVTNDTVEQPPVTNEQPPVTVEQPPVTPRSKRYPSTKLRLELTVDSSLRRFNFNDLMLATRSFQSENFLDERGFGKVLKGWVNEHGNYAARPGMGIPVTVKILNLNDFQGDDEWLSEIRYLSGLHHPNLIKLVGYCIEDGKRLLVYEYMCQGSLEKHLFNTRTVHLSWHVRMKIAIGAADGLAFLHEEALRPVIFRDFKTSNILLDEDYNAKLSDYGLANDAPVGNASHISTQIKGTIGYVAPEYMITGQHTSKSDVYSFGVVLLEILTGRRAMDERMPLEDQNLVSWLRPRLRSKANFRYLMDPRLEDQYPMKSAHRAMRLATHCIRLDPNSRPLMSEVVHELKSLPLHYDGIASQHSPSTSVPSTLLHRSHVGHSNHGVANKHGLRNGPAPNFPSHFQASSPSQYYPLPQPNPGVRTSSKPTVASS